MSTLLPFLVIGITSGAVYGLGGVGLVLTYKTSGILNFGHGAIATAGAFAFFHLFEERGLPVGVALVLSVVAVGAVVGLVLEPMARALATARLPSQVTATVGVLLAVQSVLVIQYGAGPRRFPQYLPTDVHRILGTNVRTDQIIVVVVSLAATVALTAFLRRSVTGRAMRAIVDDPELLSLGGTNPVAVRRWAWVIGSVFATLSGVLIAPNLQLDATALTLLVVQAFGAAAIGRFRSLPMTWVGGVVIGIGAALSTNYIGSISWLRGVPGSLPFLVLIVGLLFTRPASAVVTDRLRSLRTVAPARPRALRRDVVTAVVIVGALLVVPQVVGFRTDAWTIGLSHFILLLSLGLLVRTSGQVSLCHVTFAAIGAAGFSRLAIEGSMPWLVALLLAGLVAVPIGALVAIPAVRLSGLYLALATFGFGILVQSLLYNTDVMFGIENEGRLMPRPDIAGIDFGDSTNFYYLVLGISLLAALLVTVLTRSRLGRLLQALGDSPTALATSGDSVALLRVLVFCISAFLAAISGALSGMVVSTVTGESFVPFQSRIYVVVIVIALGPTPWYALVVAVGLDLIPTYLEGNSSSWLHLVFGLSAIAVGVGVHPHLPSFLRRHRAPVRDDEAVPATTDRPPATPARVRGAAPAHGSVAPIGLEVRDLTVSFGGLVAIDGLSLSSPAGRITGLIGPNGAGKTTTFNACTGLVRPRQGHVLLGGEDVTRASPADRARRGLGRTFQRTELYDSLTVRQNVALGREAALAGRRPFGHLVTAPAERDAIAAAADEAIELCGLSAIAARQVGSLSTGQRRLVELARCLAGPFGQLLLDEPSSGLDNAETERFGRLLVDVVAERGCGILLVEHDMTLVMAVCAHIHVVDFGRKIFEGSPDEVRGSTVVRAAYLGSVVADAEPLERAVP